MWAAASCDSACTTTKPATALLMSDTPLLETFLVFPSGPPEWTITAAFFAIQSPQAFMPLAISSWLISGGGPAPGDPMYSARNVFMSVSCPAYRQEHNAPVGNTG